MSVKIAIWLSQEELETFDKICDKLGKNRSYMVQQWIDQERIMAGDNLE